MNNTFDLDALVRPEIRDLSQYKSARGQFTTGAGLLLDANENPYSPTWAGIEDLNRYPDPKQEALRDAVASWRGLRAENVFAGSGSDEAIDLLMRIFGRPGKDRIIVTPPTYGMYRVAADIQGLGVTEVMLNDRFEPDVDAILEAAVPETKLLFLCSPNNPTGNTFPDEPVERLLEEFHGIVVIDEAYIDFSEKEGWASRVTEFPNLVVLQTLSKSFGLAGIRLGMAYASESLVRYFMKVKPPYNVNALTSSHALEALKHLEVIAFNIAKIKEERERLREKLETLDAVREVFPSDTNFLLARFDKAKEHYRRLTEKGVIVRYRGDEPMCGNCLRITVGTPGENNLLVTKLKEIDV